MEAIANGLNDMYMIKLLYSKLPIYFNNIMNHAKTCMLDNESLLSFKDKAEDRWIAPLLNGLDEAQGLNLWDRYGRMLVINRNLVQDMRNSQILQGIMMTSRLVAYILSLQMVKWSKD